MKLAEKIILYETLTSDKIGKAIADLKKKRSKVDLGSILNTVLQDLRDIAKSSKISSDIKRKISIDITKISNLLSKLKLFVSPSLNVKR